MTTSDFRRLSDWYGFCDLQKRLPTLEQQFSEKRSARAKLKARIERCRASGERMPQTVTTKRPGRGNVPMQPILWRENTIASCVNSIQNGSKTMGKTNIGWCDYSLNFYTWDCTKVSPGCKNCYMMALAERYGKPLVGRPQWRGANAYKELKAIPSGSVVFVNDMSDTYHENVPAAWIHAIHNAAAYNRPDLTFLLLTKRPERAYAMRHTLAWPKNLWLGTSVENEDYLWRLWYVIQTPAAGKFVSAEPLLGSLKFGFEAYLDRGIDWVIVGAESGAGRRDFNPDWAREIRDMCIRTGARFFFKQGSGFKPGQNRTLDKREWNETPFILQTKHEAAKVGQLELF